MLKKLKNPVAPVAMTAAAIALLTGGIFVSRSVAQTVKGRVAPSVKATTKAHCGTPDVSEAEVAKINAEVDTFMAKYRSENGRSPEARNPGTVIVPVVWHVITNTSGTGNLTDAQIVASIKVLNTAYSGKDRAAKQLGQPDSPQATANTPYRFRLIGITRTTNNAWFTATDNGSAQTQMKATLRQGNAATMNVYSNTPIDGSTGDELLGYATFPTSYAGNPTNDGVVIAYNSFPGGAAPYNEGDTLTHEAGHWLGLFHTFQSGCIASGTGGDGVADTPAEGSPYFAGVQTGPNFRDTCTGSSFPGRDPYENYMDYSQDIALFQFTTGQSARMDALTLTYRGL